ncbi:MAG TPA: hypothetical protein VFG54_03935 [Prolixibacteraceae bacterium]|nr:hypothetical protein [Prolixibacteraceae bacterium]
MKTFALVLCVLFLTSCATLVNTPYSEINLYTKQDSVKVYLNNSADYSLTPARVSVERSEEPLRITLEKDEQKEKIMVPSRVSPQFWMGNLFMGAFFFGYIVDLSNDRRFTYPRKIYVDMDDPDKVDYRFRTREKPQNLLMQIPQKKTYTVQKGTVNIKLSIPEGNSFFLNKQTHIGNTFGFLGITTGVDYYYKDKRYWGLGAGAVIDFIAPFPAPYDFWGEYERSSGLYVDLLHGMDIHRFSVNYGLSFTRYDYEKGNTEDYLHTDSLSYPTYSYYTKAENRLGLSLSAKYKFTNYFNVGMKYLPSFYTLDSREFRYGHLLFLDIAINYAIKPRRKHIK